MKYIKLTSVIVSVLLFGCSNNAELLKSPPPELLAQVEPYTQPAIDYAKNNEKEVLENGSELTVNEKKLARKIGIKNVDKIRVMYVNEFPFPKDKKLGELASSVGFDSPFMGGFTFGYGIYIRNGEEQLLAHELIHVRQYENMGIDAFMTRYMLELAVMGYRAAPLEIEAYNESANY